MTAAEVRQGRFAPPAATATRFTATDTRAVSDLKRLLGLYVASMFVTAFFVDQGSHDVRAVGSGAINLGSIVFAFSFCVILGFAFVSFSAFKVNTTSLTEIVRRPASCAFAVLLLMEVFSSLYASAPIGAIYQSAPGLLTLVVMLCFYSRLRFGVHVPRAQLSALWNHAMLLQTFALGLLLISAVSGSNGFLREGGILPIRLRGTWFIIHPDLSGLLAEVGLAHFLIRPIKPRLLHWAMIAINLLVFVLAQSRTSYSVGAITFLVWYLMKGRRSLAFNALAICLLPVAGFMTTLVVGLFRRGQSDTELSGLTGRTKLWSAAMEFGAHRPLFGYGAFSGVRLDFATVFAQMFPRFEIRTLDNQFVNTFIECGAIGVLALVATIIFMIIGTLRATRQNTSTLAIEMLAFSVALPVRAWLNQVFVLYDPTQLYGMFIALWILLSVRSPSSSAVSYRYPRGLIPPARRQSSGRGSDSPSSVSATLIPPA